VSLRQHLATAVTVPDRPGAETSTMPADAPPPALARPPTAPPVRSAARRPRWALAALHGLAAAAGLAAGYLFL